MQDGGYSAAIPAASWPPLAGAQWEDRSCPLPPPHTPATCPVPEANREKAASQRGRAHKFAASERARAGVQGSSYRRPELGEFIPHPSAAVRRRRPRRGRLPGRRGGAGREAGGRPRCLPRWGSGCAALRCGRGRLRC